MSSTNEIAEALGRIRGRVAQAESPLGHTHEGSLMLNCRRCGATFGDHNPKSTDLFPMVPALIEACEILAKALDEVGCMESCDGDGHNYRCTVEECRAALSAAAQRLGESKGGE